jgi:(E)-4-hydroxy-3-methylbut-2-enyl-diphosphate synthase
VHVQIRINPGNFADGRKTFEEINYDDPAQFAAERDHIREVFTPLVLKCKELGRAMRIGTNHGSLSARILSYYGDTPRWVLTGVSFYVYMGTPCLASCCRCPTR